MKNRSLKRVTAVLLSVAILSSLPQNAYAFNGAAGADMSDSAGIFSGANIMSDSAGIFSGADGVDIPAGTGISDFSAGEILSTLGRANAGEDYDEDEVMFYLGYDPDEKLIEKARQTAFSCNGELLDYEMGVGLIKLPATPEEAEANAKTYAQALYGEETADLFLDGREYEEVTVDEAVRENLEDSSAPVFEPNYFRGLADAPLSASDNVDNVFADAPLSASDNDFTDTRSLASDDIFADTGDETSPDTSWLPNDPFLDPDERGYQYHHHMTGSELAWKAGYSGKSEIRVAVIDTGVAADHADLQNIEQIQFSQRRDLPLEPDTQAHGTHVAGIIAAVSGNQTGGVGIAPGVTILSYNIEHTGKINLMSYDIVCAMLHCIEDKADIVNMSIGSASYSRIENEAVEELYRHGITAVAAMGNNGSELKCYPAAYDYVISVAATGESGARADYSNFGDWCTISAPGSNIVSTVMPRLKADCYDNGDFYYSNYFGYMSGTSQATPVVTGAAALYMSTYGNPGPDKMKEILCKNVIECPSAGMGAGIIDIAALMSASGAADHAFDSRSRVNIHMDSDPVSTNSDSSVEVGSSLKLWAAYDTEPAGILGPDRVEWTILENDPMESNLDDRAFAKGMVTIDQNGLLKVKKKCFNYLVNKRSKRAQVRVRATTAEGFWCEKNVLIVQKCGSVSKVKKWKAFNVTGKTVTKSSSTIKLNAANPCAEVNFSIKTYAANWRVESSDPDVAGAVIIKPLTVSNTYASTKCTMQIIGGERTGTATITAYCLDGSGKKVKWKVTCK